MSKNIQIPISLFLDIYRLIIALEDEILVTGSDEIAKRIKNQIEAKIDAMNKQN